MAKSRRWTDVTRSEHAHEKAALNFIRERFSDREPFRAWSNFTFQADDGSINEVDLLVISPTGMYLVEIKSYPGRIEGDAGTWRWIPPDSDRPLPRDNPLPLTDRKAKKLKSLLIRQPALRASGSDRPSFFLAPIVFLSDPTLRVALDPDGRQHVYGPDTERDDQINDLPGIMRLFNDVGAVRGRRIDRPLSARIAQALDQAGIRQSVQLQKAGHYTLGELLDEGDGWQDFEAIHPKYPKHRRRLRIYLTEDAASEEDRKALQRAVDREFKILREITEPGIERPIDVVDSERGPALIYDWDPDAVRLDHWLEEHGDQLDLLDRTELLQQLAERIRSIHRKGVYHRALSPRCIRVTGGPEGQFLTIQNWQTATGTLSSSVTSTTRVGTTYVPAHVQGAEELYLAPEILRVSDPDPLRSDIWSLGALSVLILANQPPAPDADGLRQLQREHGCLSLSAVMDAPHKELEELVATATASEPPDRFVSADEFLQFLEMALEEITRPETRDILKAQKGDQLEDGREIYRRVGTGSTSVVFIIGTDEGFEAWKVARSEEHGQRLRKEFETLEKLRDNTIIKPFGLDTVGGRTVLRLEFAPDILGDELRENGPLSLDLLDRFGRDLLDAVVFLDEEGVAHRDLKPDNLGIVTRGKNDERRLALFDFSLVGSDPTRLHLGTRGYQDPFLEERSPPRWDGQAERYAAGVTLYEMATGVRPRWGDGSTDPILTDLTLPEIDGDLFDPAVREEMVDFFRSALHRDPTERFDTAGQMRDAWIRVFHGTELDPDHADGGVSVAELELEGLTKTSLLLELPLSPRVRNALERIDVHTPEDLLAIPAQDLVRLSGVSALVRAEINLLAKALREHLGTSAKLFVTSARSVDRVAEELVPKPPADEDHRTVVRTMFGFVETEVPRWPTQRDILSSAGLGEELVVGALGSARTRWRKMPTVTELRREIEQILLERGGIAGADELADLLLSSRGSTASEPERSRRARALVRAAMETEGTLQSPTFVPRRAGETLLLALTGTVDVEGDPVPFDADELTEGAVRLGEVARELADQNPLPERDRVVEALRDVELPASMTIGPDARLVRLAAAAAEGVAVSPQLLLYPEGMSAERAVQETRSVLLTRRGLSVENVRERVSSRFPEAAPCPSRPALDRLLEPLGFRWDPEADKYGLIQRGGILSTRYSSTASATILPTDQRTLEMKELDRRLASLVERGGFLALTVDGRRLDAGADAVARATQGHRIRLDQRLVTRLRDLIESTPGGRWAKVLEADARRNERPWSRLVQVVDRVLPEVEKEILEHEGLVVLTDIGLLARYGRMSLMDRLRDAVTVDASEDGLRALVVLTPSESTRTHPTIDGHPVPVITPNQHARLYTSWLSSQSEGDAA